MRLHPLTNQVFSTDRQKEKLFRYIFAVAVLAGIFVLYWYWQTLRSPELTYPIASWTVTNRRWDLFFRLVTALGSEGFFLIVFSIIYWCVNKSMGFWGMVFMPLSILVTSEIPKDITRLPRPEVRGVAVPTYTFPSGHTSGATVVWGYAAIIVRKTWFWLLASGTVILVGLSRITLGYHFPGDVLGGLITGVLFLTVVVWLRLRVGYVGLSDRIPWPGQIFLVLAVPLLFAFLPVKAGPGLLGYCSGASVGYLLQIRFVRFRLEGKWEQYIYRSLLGLPPIALFILLVAPSLPPSLPALKFIPYFLTTLWITVGSPVAFSRVGIMTLSDGSSVTSKAER